MSLGSTSEPGQVGGGAEGITLSSVIPFPISVSQRQHKKAHHQSLNTTLPLSGNGRLLDWQWPLLTEVLFGNQDLTAIDRPLLQALA